VKKWRGQWFVYRTKDGEEKRIPRSKVLGLISTMTKGEAQAELDKLIQRETSQTPTPDAAITLAQLITDVYLPIKMQRWSANARASMMGSINRYVLPQLGAIPLAELNKVRIEKHLLGLAGMKLGYDSIDRVRVILRAALEEALENDYIDKNPARKAQMPCVARTPDQRVLDEDQVRKLFGAAHGRDYMVFRLLLLCGLRPGEVFTLRRNDFGPWGLRIDESWDRTPSRSKTTKTGRQRIVPLPVIVRAELEQWIAGCVGLEPEALLFPNRRHRIGCHPSEQNIVKRAREKTGIKELTFRICRRTFATLFRGDVKDIQAILGHTTPMMTLEHYRQPIPERQQAAVDELADRLKERVN